MDRPRLVLNLAALAVAIPATLVLGSCWFMFDNDPGDDDDDWVTWCDCSSVGETACGDWDHLTTCDNGCDWTWWDCDDLCAGAGYARSAGCEWDSSSYEYACLCTDDVACECDPGETDCWSSSTILSCGDDCMWASWDCDDLCQDSGWDGADGCEWDSDSGQDVCTCYEDIDCDCTEGETDCWGMYTLRSCEDGCWWTEYDCDELCEYHGYDYSTGCDYDYDIGDWACSCESDVTCECSSGETYCSDSWTLVSCDDGCWYTYYDCDELCQYYGYSYSTGCSYDYESYESVCYCA